MTTTLIFGVFVGAVMGLTGAGGGIFAVPALVFGLGWSVAQAAPVALLAVAGAAAVGAVDGLLRKLVRYKAAALIALVGIPVTTLGVRTAHALPEPTLLFVFAGILTIVAIRMFLDQRPLQGERFDQARADLPCQMDASTGRLHWTPTTALALSSIGAVSGFLAGLLGVGGGFFVVPALRRVSDISMHGVVATSLAVTALVGGGAVFSAWRHGASLPGEIAVSFLVSAALGMVAGRFLVRHLPTAQVQRTFGVLMFVVALSLAVKAVAK